MCTEYLVGAPFACLRCYGDQRASVAALSSPLLLALVQPSLGGALQMSDGVQVR